MDWPLALATLGFLLVAIGISSRDTGVWSMLSGMGLVVAGITWSLLTAEGLFSALLDFLWTVGLGLLVAAVWLGARKLGTRAQPLLMLSLGCLTLAGLLFGASHLWQLVWVHDEHSLLVELGPDDTIDEVESILDDYNATWEQAFPTISLAEDEDLAQMYLVHVRETRANHLMDDLRADTENVDHVELNIEVALSPIESLGTPRAAQEEILENDPMASSQWAIEAISGHQAHALIQDWDPQRKARVAILDTGVEAAHEDLAAAFEEAEMTDAHGHGTHCAGIAGAVTNNGLGVASLNWEGRFIELLAFRALKEDGSGSLEQIAQALVDASQAGVDVVSMSLGSVAESPPRVLVAAVRYALKQGAIVVASAGNSDEDAINHYPSNIDGVIAVAAVDSTLSKARFSNMVGRLESPIAAPGVDLLSSHLDGTYKTMSGTSMAAPVVAGLLGVMRAMDPSLTPKSAYEILHQTGTAAQDVSLTGRVVNAEAALRAVDSGQ